MTPQEFINLLSDKIDNIKDFPVLKSLAISQHALFHFGKNIFIIIYLGLNATIQMLMLDVD